MNSGLQTAALPYRRKFRKDVADLSMACSCTEHTHAARPRLFGMDFANPMPSSVDYRSAGI